MMHKRETYCDKGPSDAGGYANMTPELGLKLMKILGIETSCDETGVAVYDSERGILSNQIYSQVKVHAPFGGVVPELASRDHIRKTLPLIRRTLNESHIDLSVIDGIAYTAGPGLIGSLMVGAGIGQNLAWALEKPAIGVHHMEAHMLAPLIADQKPDIPYLALLVSGGHTLIVRVDGIGNYRILGESLDDAAGEAFDKVAKLLGLSYPGGPALAKLAESGVPNRFRFPRPMTDRPSLDFSFSGLKTAVLTKVREQHTLNEQTRADIAYAFEDAVVETIEIKCERALKEQNIESLVLGGGVAANTRLRERLERLNASVYYAPLELCTDNGAMIAYAGHVRLQAGFCENPGVFVRARWPVSDIEQIGASNKSL